MFHTEHFKVKCFWIMLLFLEGTIDFASLSAEGSEEWMVAVDVSGQLYLRQGTHLAAIPRKCQYLIFPQGNSLIVVVKTDFSYYYYY